MCCLSAPAEDPQNHPLHLFIKGFGEPRTKSKEAREWRSTWTKRILAYSAWELQCHRQALQEQESGYQKATYFLFQRLIIVVVILNSALWQESFNLQISAGFYLESDVIKCLHLL